MSRSRSTYVDAVTGGRGCQTTYLASRLTKINSAQKFRAEPKLETFATRYLIDGRLGANDNSRVGIMKCVSANDMVNCQSRI